MLRNRSGGFQPRAKQSLVWIILGQLGNYGVKRVIDPAPLVVEDVIIVSNGRPNQAFPWERLICDDIRHVPILARICEFAFVVSNKSNNTGWQIFARMNLVEARCIQQNRAVFR